MADAPSLAAPEPRLANTGDPIDPAVVRADVSAVMDALAKEGGVAIAPLDVAYAVIAQTRAGIESIFRAKQRSYTKPSGFFGDADLCDEIHLLPGEKRAMVRGLIAQVGLPFSVVAPFREDHALLRAADPWVLETSTKGGTLDMLMNAGVFHDEIARQARERGRPVFGSSANTSLQGSKYRFADIEAPVREAATIAFDYGLSKYVNPLGRSSTIVDFADFSVIRIGVEYDRLAAGFRDLYGVELTITEATAGKAA